MKHTGASAYRAQASALHARREERQRGRGVGHVSSTLSFDSSEDDIFKALPNSSRASAPAQSYRPGAEADGFVPRTTVLSSPRRLRKRAIGAAAACALLAVGIVAGVRMLDGIALDERDAMQSEDSLLAGQVSDASFNSTAIAAEAVSFTAAPAVLDEVPREEGVQTFSLAGADAPSVSDKARQSIEQALSAVQSQGKVGFVVYDVDSGAGISCNPDISVYGASSFKAPYALYVCETQVETGAVTLPSVSDNPFEGLFGQGSYVEQCMQNAIVYSDNDSFSALRRMFDDEGYEQWEEYLGIYDTALTEESDFPWYCPRSSAKVWTEMYNYLLTGSDNALWLTTTCTQTTTSFLRDALESQGAEVMNKAGWYADSDMGSNAGQRSDGAQTGKLKSWRGSSSYAYADEVQAGDGATGEASEEGEQQAEEEPGYNSICDAGIVTIGGKTYVASFMSGMPDSDENRELLENLIEAVFGAIS